MQTKEYSMTLDMKRTLPFRPFEVVEGDTGNVLHITLQNDGEAMDLSGCGLCIVFASSAGFAIQDLSSGVWRGEGLGEIVVRLNPAAYGAGNVSADVQVYSGENDETLITSTRFDFRCRRSMISEDIIRANTAYPPLVTAAAEARAAAAAALAAAERISGNLGEQNVQADWAETDTENDAYIRNKPLGFSPSAHAQSHAEGGADALLPESIGAAAAVHAARHGEDGADPLSPGAIGAAAAMHALQHGKDGADPLTPDEIGAAALDEYGKVMPQQLSSRSKAITSNYTLTREDDGIIILANNAGTDITITIPTNAAASFPELIELVIVRWATGGVTITGASGVTICSAVSSGNRFGPRSLGVQFSSVVAKRLYADTWLLTGGMA
jgi:hypothetical protein